MSKRRCCDDHHEAGIGSLCSNPICALIVLIILQRTCLLEDKNAFLLILLFLGFCFCKGGFLGCPDRKRCC